MRFMAMARLVCASRLMEPKLIAPVAKRLTISAAGSTSSSGMDLFGEFEFHQSANGEQPFGLLVDRGRERLIFVRQIAAHRMLQLGNRFRRPCMILAADAEGIIAADIEHVGVDRIVAISVAVAAHAFLGDFRQGPRLRWWWPCR